MKVIKINGILLSINVKIFERKCSVYLFAKKVGDEYRDLYATEM